MLKKLIPLLLLSLSMAGCTTTEITNLTSKHELRNQNGFYPVEAAFNSSQQSLRWDNIKAQAIVENDSFPMTLTRLMTNRWETLIPVPPNVNVVYFRFKFDYKYNAFGGPPRKDSKLSQIYRLQIIDK